MIELDAIEEMVNKNAYRDNIKQSIFIAQSLGLRGTPAFILGDEVINQFITKEELEKRFSAMK